MPDGQHNLLICRAPVCRTCASGASVFVVDVDVFWASAVVSRGRIPAGTPVGEIINTLADQLTNCSLVQVSWDFGSQSCGESQRSKRTNTGTSGTKYLDFESSGTHSLYSAAAFSCPGVFSWKPVGGTRSESIHLFGVGNPGSSSGCHTQAVCMSLNALMLGAAEARQRFFWRAIAQAPCFLAFLETRLAAKAESTLLGGLWIVFLEPR